MLTVIKSRGITPAHTEVARFLIEHNADVNTVDQVRIKGRLRASAMVRVSLWLVLDLSESSL